jgi:hypothetical protein
MCGAIVAPPLTHSFFTVLGSHMRLILLAASLLALAPGLSAQIVKSTFGAGVSYDERGWWHVWPHQQSVAQGFTYEGPSSLLFRVRLALPEAAAYTVSFWQGPSITGATKLEEWNDVNAGHGVTQLLSLRNPSLLTGESYWVTVFNAREYGGWHFNSIGDQGLHYTFGSDPLGPWSFCGHCASAAYDVAVTPSVGVTPDLDPPPRLEIVPEPNSTWLFGTGVLILGLAARRFVPFLRM